MIRTFLNTAPGEVISITADAGSTPRFCRRSMKPSLAERRDQRAGPRVDRVDAIAHEVEDALALGPLPVHHAAVAQPDDVAVVVLGRIEGPDLAAGRRVQRHRLQARRRHVHHAVHHDRIHVHRRSLVRVAGLVLPGALEPVDVGGVDLRQRRVLVALRIAAVDGPVDAVGPPEGTTASWFRATTAAPQASAAATTTTVDLRMDCPQLSAIRMIRQPTVTVTSPVKPFRNWHES